MLRVGRQRLSSIPCIPHGAVMEMVIHMVPVERCWNWMMKMIIKTLNALHRRWIVEVVVMNGRMQENCGIIAGRVGLIFPFTSTSNLKTACTNTTS